ncbi:MAG: ATP-binding protein [Myxococcota bacterium]
MIEDSSRDLFTANVDLQKQVSLFGSLLDALQIGVLGELPDGTICFANAYFCRLFDINGSPQELLGFPHAQISGLEQAIPQARILAEEITLKNGKICERDYIPIVDQNKQLINHLWIYRDVTDQRKLETQLRQSQKMESIGQLAGGIAHDFNNLLTVIIAQTETIKTANSVNPQEMERIKTISTCAERAASLTKQLLAFSRQEIIHVSILDFNATIANTVKILSQLIGENIQIKFRPTNNGLPVKADRSQIEQILMNLAVNARDAMPNGGELTIETGLIELPEKGRMAMLAVSDTGVGMDQKTVEKIFEPFFTTKAVGKGTGMGLATVHGIVQQHGGSISAQSEPGSGTTFKLYFPCIENQVPAEPESIVPSITSAPAEGTGTILVVEDEDMVRQIVVDILQSNGYKVLQAPDGIEALKIYATYSGPIDLVLTDVIMPNMGGADLVAKLKAQHKVPHTMFMSGYTANTIAEQGILPRDVNFIHKPFVKNDLLRAVQEAIKTSKT